MYEEIVTKNRKIRKDLSMMRFSSSYFGQHYLILSKGAISHDMFLDFPYLDRVILIEVLRMCPTTPR